VLIHSQEVAMEDLRFVTEAEFFAREREQETLAVRPCLRGGRDHVGPFYEGPGHPDRTGKCPVYLVCSACGHATEVPGQFDYLL
jgi:hypothetical protein